MYITDRQNYIGFTYRIYICTYNYITVLTVIVVLEFYPPSRKLIHPIVPNANAYIVHKLQASNNIVGPLTRLHMYHLGYWYGMQNRTVSNEWLCSQHTANVYRAMLHCKYIFFVGTIKGPGIMRILGLDRIHVMQNLRQWDCRGSPTNAKIPYLRVYKPKIVVVGTAVVKTA